MKHRISVPVALLAWVALFGVTPAADWPQFRGLNGAGVSEDTSIPVKWTADDVAWKVNLNGVGNASPIVSKGRLFLHLSARDGSARSLLCLDAISGKKVWEQSIPGKTHKTHGRNSLASATPAADGQHVVVPFWDGTQVVLHAYDFSGKQLWTYNLGGFASQHGAGSSPVIHDGKVFFLHDQDGDRAANPARASVLVCLDVASGKKLWEAVRPPVRACYGPPLILNRDGRKELIVATTAAITSYQLDDGKVNWNLSSPFQDNRLRVVGGPVLAGDLLIASSGNGEGGRNTVAVKLPGSANGSASAAWSIRKGSLGAYVPAVLLKGDHLYWVTDKGDGACVSLRDGKEVWSDRVGEGFTASPLLIDGKVYAFGEKGNIYVFKATPEKLDLLAKNDAGEAIAATPAVADGRLYIRTRTQLLCIGKK